MLKVTLQMNQPEIAVVRSTQHVQTKTVPESGDWKYNISIKISNVHSTYNCLYQLYSQLKLTVVCTLVITKFREYT